MIQKFQTIAEALDALRRETGKTCVSIVLPLEHLTPGQQKDYKKLDKAVHEAAAMLEKQSAEESRHLRLALPLMAKTIKFNRKDMGLGIYMTEHIAYHVTFPFSVKEYVGVSNAFRLKELYQLAQYGTSYFLLAVSEKKARLFAGQDARLHEISNKYFPLEYVEEYEYAEPSRSSSFAGSAHVKSFERDKRTLQKKRFNDFLGKVDGHLGHYLDKHQDRFMVCGSKMHIANFLQKTRHQDNLIGVHQGGYDWLDEVELSEMVWPSIEKYNDEKIENVLKSYQEKSGEGRCAHGLDQVWNALKEGRVNTLILEKDFDASGYSPDDMPHLIMSQPPAAPFTFHPSVANELIEMAVSEKGNVIFVNKGKIPGGEPVGSICRY